jgi:hypothetical protein
MIRGRTPRRLRHPYSYHPSDGTPPCPNPLLPHVEGHLTARHGLHLLLAGATRDRPAPTAGVRTDTGAAAGLAADPAAARALRDVVDSQAEKSSMTTMDYSAMAFN